MTASNPSRTIEDDTLGLPQRIHESAPRIRSFLSRLCAGTADRGHVDDLVQDVMERAIRYAHGFDEAVGTLDNWLMKTAFHTFLDHRSRRERQPRCLGDAVSLVHAPAEASAGEAAELRDEVGFLLGHVSPIEQDIVLRFHQRRETIEEIGRELSMPTGTVKSHLHRARHKLAAANQRDDGREG